MAYAKDYQRRPSSTLTALEETYPVAAAPEGRDGLQRKERIALISIRAIVPDQTQPRRAVPSVLRHLIDASNMAGLFERWAAYGENDLGRIVAAMIRGDEVERPEALDGVEAGLIDLAGLATSIRRDGLTNPVTVAALGDAYHLETGERRWLAYWLLYVVTQDDQWLTIRARVMPAVDVWRQATENNARAGLNAIGRARQFAILMMALHANEGVRFVPYRECSTDRMYYAQARELRTPRGQGETLLSALGVSSRSALDRYRALLDLDEETWTRADDQNLSERELFRTQNISPAADEHVPAVLTGEGVERGDRLSNPPAAAGAKRVARGGVSPEVLRDRRWLDSVENLDALDSEMRAEAARRARALAAYYAGLAEKAERGRDG
jgi:hypothetical protein